MTLRMYQAMITLRHKIAGAVYRYFVAPSMFDHAQATRVILDRIAAPAQDIAHDLKNKENQHDQREPAQR
jgi:hypothetical protein